MKGFLFTRLLGSFNNVFKFLFKSFDGVANFYICQQSGGASLSFKFITIILFTNLSYLGDIWLRQNLSFFSSIKRLNWCIFKICIWNVLFLHWDLSCPDDTSYLNNSYSYHCDKTFYIDPEYLPPSPSPLQVVYRCCNHWNLYEGN